MSAPVLHQAAGHVPERRGRKRSDPFSVIEYRADRVHDLGDFARLSAWALDGTLYEIVAEGGPGAKARGGPLRLVVSSAAYKRLLGTGCLAPAEPLPRQYVPRRPLNAG